MMKQIETNRLILRELSHLDVDGIFEMDKDPDVMRYIGVPVVNHIDESRVLIDEILAQYKDTNIGRWAVIDKAANEFLGWSGLKFYKEPINNHVNFYELGYRFLQKHWGKGYATESSTFWLQYGFETLNAEAIYAITDVEHSASINVLEKLGFTNVEVFVDNDEKLNWFRLTKEEWEDYK